LDVWGLRAPYQCCHEVNGPPYRCCCMIRASSLHKQGQTLNPHLNQACVMRFPCREFPRRRKSRTGLLCCVFKVSAQVTVRACIVLDRLNCINQMAGCTRHHTGAAVRSGRAGRPAARRGPCREGQWRLTPLGSHSSGQFLSHSSQLSIALSNRHTGACIPRLVDRVKQLTLHRFSRRSSAAQVDRGT
jgi:hypothetical protein